MTWMFHQLWYTSCQSINEWIDDSFQRHLRLLLHVESSAKHSQHKRLKVDSESKYIQFTYSSCFSFSCPSKFRLKEFGTPHHFTHARIHSAGGFYNNERPPVLSGTEVGPRLPTLAFHTPISIWTSSSWEDEVQKIFVDAYHTTFRVPTESRGGGEGGGSEQQQTNLPPHHPRKD